MLPANINALKLAHSFLRKAVPQGGICIDATVGRGRDTLLLCQLVGDTGSVTGFDIQQQALDSAKKRLDAAGQTATLLLDSHSNMEQYFAPGSVDAIVFNFGWLPGGDHSIMTQAESSIAAIKAGLSLLKEGGVMSLCLYYGRDTGYEEKDAILEYLPSIDPAEFTVLVTEFVNRPNDPPIPIFIRKDLKNDPAQG